MQKEISFVSTSFLTIVCAVCCCFKLNVFWNWIEDNARTAVRVGKAEPVCSASCCVISKQLTSTLKPAFWN